jgi:PTS system ascorbate-specific IIA component
MSVGVLLITHPGVGSSLLHAATRILGETSLATRCLEIPPGSDVDAAIVSASGLLQDLDSGDGVLILTDIYGSTPSNIGCALHSRGGTAVVSGMNLPMLIRTFNYPGEDLSSLQQRASEGGTRGVHLHTLPGG